jgi:hypothetical protein
LWKRAIRLATEVECMTISKPKLIYSLERAVPAGPMESKDKMRGGPVSGKVTNRVKCVL